MGQHVGVITITGFIKLFFFSVVYNCVDVVFSHTYVSTTGEYNIGH